VIDAIVVIVIVAVVVAVSGGSSGHCGRRVRVIGAGAVQ
jgi:hypothetical protein